MTKFLPIENSPVTIKELLWRLRFFNCDDLIERIEQHGMQINTDELANQFMGWKLPDDFNPDCGISFKRQADYVHPKFGAQVYNPIGTNLLTLKQAKEMFEYVVTESLKVKSE